MHDTLTVGQLIKLLQGYDENIPVGVKLKDDMVPQHYATGVAYNETHSAGPLPHSITQHGWFAICAAE